ncbi:hypothetical protein HPB49_009250 [Dermacentor silvarum]|uniref:Uncharacterized protein n=1 Tax=Dermacentor silvarum TaxID=543639 RepID=A0ACB8CE47_DERSI|nr:hypothetical protein HPB49_009250 [Dermacentor silvarum]
MADFTDPSCGPPRKGHRRSASATLDMPQSLGLELRHRDAARARAADIVDQWLARRGAATRRPSAPAASVADVPVPSGEVPSDLHLTTPAPAALQPTDTFEPVTVELPVTSDEEVMDESTSRKRGRDSEDEEEVFKQSKGLGALPDSKRKPLTPPSGSTAGERAPDAATAATGAVGPAASTPTAEKAASTAVPEKPATTPTGVTASLETAEPRQLEPHRKVPQHTAADFLKRNRRPATNVATKKQKKKKTARAKHPPPAGAPLAGSSSLQDASPDDPSDPDWEAEAKRVEKDNDVLKAANEQLKTENVKLRKRVEMLEKALCSRIFKTENCLLSQEHQPGCYMMAERHIQQKKPSPQVQVSPVGCGSLPPQVQVSPRRAEQSTCHLLHPHLSHHRPPGHCPLQRPNF